MMVTMTPGTLPMPNWSYPVSGDPDFVICVRLLPLGDHGAAVNGAAKAQRGVAALGKRGHALETPVHLTGGSRCTYFMEAASPAP